jgi:hypothetical protein
VGETSTDMVFPKAFCNDGRAESIISYAVHGPSGKELFQVDDCFGGVEVLGSNAYVFLLLNTCIFTVVLLITTEVLFEWTLGKTPSV